MVVSGEVLHAAGSAAGYVAFELSSLSTGQYTPVACSVPAAWNLSPALGSITESGLYTAPSSVASTQTVTVTGTDADDATHTASTTLTLWPGLLVTLTAAAPAPYTLGASATFNLSVTNFAGTPQPGVSVSFASTGANVRNSTASSDSSGHASFTYTGAQTGQDLIQATAHSGAMGVVSNLLSVAWG